MLMGTRLMRTRLMWTRLIRTRLLKTKLLRTGLLKTKLLRTRLLIAILLRHRLTWSSDRATLHILDCIGYLKRRMCWSRVWVVV
jgi:hypothetical protein